MKKTDVKTYTKTNMETVMQVLDGISKTAVQARELARRRHKSIDWAFNQIVSDRNVDSVENPVRMLSGIIASDIVRKLKSRSADYSDALEKLEKRAAELRSR